MFERIPLLYGGHEVSHRDILEKTRQIAASNAIGDDALTAAQAQTQSCFLIDGEIRLLFPFSTTERERECYFYPQLFCYMSSGKKYYTRRKDYDSYEILYTYEGRGELRYCDKTYSLTAGDGVLINCNLPHEYHTVGEKWVHSDLHFNGPACEALYREYAREGDVLFHEAADDRYQALLERALEAWSQVRICRILAVSTVIGEILLHLIRRKAGPRATEDSMGIARLVDYIQNHYREAMTLETMAGYLRVSTSHLSHEFRRQCGMAPIEYLLYIRVENARQMLALTDRPIYEIAEQMGFSDVNNFTRQFKKRTGMTPRDYRRGLTRQSDPSDR